MDADTIIVGAGAAGLMAAIWAGRTNPDSNVVVLDGAKKLGAKILVAGGGRCNVTHKFVDDATFARAFAGSSPNAIKKVLRGYSAEKTVKFFAEIGVELKREETGKLFPVTDSARTVLNALLDEARRLGVKIWHPKRVESVAALPDGGFVVRGLWGELTTQSLILATGGKSLPKSGSNGHGYKLAQSLGHSVTENFYPALVPLSLPKDHFLCKLSGITLPATLELWQPNGKKLQAFTDSTLLTHFGLSGPSVLDISRYYLSEKEAVLTVNWVGDKAAEVEAEFVAGKREPISILRDHFPDRFARALLAEANVENKHMTREQRKELMALVAKYPLPITASRGYTYAEVTAGGVPLSEMNLKTMASRKYPNLYICGEICDVDGQIGGYNFQWAWSSGYLAGTAVA